MGALAAIELVTVRPIVYSTALVSAMAYLRTLSAADTACTSAYFGNVRYTNEGHVPLTPVLSGSMCASFTFPSSMSRA